MDSRLKPAPRSKTTGVDRERRRGSYRVKNGRKDYTGRGTSWNGEDDKMLKGDG
ncbi:hypothetical protein ACFL6G_08775 [candidate division KSB1 bacterium]